MLLLSACWVLESVFCGVQILLFSGASERGGILGESLQVKVIQWVVAVFVTLVQVQMHGEFAVLFGEILSGSACGAGLHSAVFHSH